MLRAVLLALVAAFAITGPASAHWQFTRWGMSKAEVTAAVEAQGRQVTTNSGGNLEMAGPYDLAGLTFDNVTFVFEGGKLERVTLSSRSVIFQEVDWAVSAAFGPPVTAGEGGRVYADREKGNSLRVYGSNPVLLVYSPIPSGF